MGCTDYSHPLRIFLSLPQWELLNNLLLCYCRGDRMVVVQTRWYVKKMPKSQYSYIQYAANNLGANIENSQLCGCTKIY